MTNKAKPIPTDYHTVTPYLFVDSATKAIEFYKKAFNATELMRMVEPGGKICHAEIKIGNSRIMLADEFPEMNVRGPQSYGGSPIAVHLYVEDVDALINQAISAGAKILRPIKDQFYGDRSGSLTDPFGHVWNIATHKEDVSPEEIYNRFNTFMKQQSQN